MPSENKFPSGLNNFAADDRPKRDDFNADNSILDELHTSAARKPETHTDGNVMLMDADGNGKDSSYSEDWLPLPNYLYAGKELPFTWAEIEAKRAVGDFSRIRVGDYKKIILTTGEIVIMEVAGINTHYNYGDTAVGHHIDWISRDCLATAQQYNVTETNSGGFVGSVLKTVLNDTIYNTLPIDLKAVIKVKRGIVETKTNDTASGWSWQELGKLWLPFEIEVWGSTVWAEDKYGGGLAMQYPIFAHSTRHITKGLGNGGGRRDWWLSSSRAASTSFFCTVYYHGNPYYNSAANASGVPLCFRT